MTSIHSARLFAAIAVSSTALTLPTYDPVVGAQTKTSHALPASATEVTSMASNVPNFMVTLDEGGTVPSEPKATCDGLAASMSSASTVGLHLEHYFPAAKDVFDQKATVLRQYMGVKTAVQAESNTKVMGSDDAPAVSAIVVETLDAMEAAYFVRTTPCVENANPKATMVYYQVRLMRDATYADIIVRLYAAGPDPARKLAREIMQKAAALNYAALK